VASSSLSDLTLPDLDFLVKISRLIAVGLGAVLLPDLFSVLVKCDLVASWGLPTEPKLAWAAYSGGP